MNKSEAAKLIYIVKANYPRHFNDMSKEDFSNLVFTWQMCLEDYDYNLAQAGLKIFLSSEIKGFPPTVGQVIDGIHKILYDQSENITELDAWGFVYKAVCNSNYNSEQEFSKLPEIVQRAVGNPARLKEWAQLDLDNVMTVSQSNFMRSYRAVQEQKKLRRKVPEDIKKMLSEDEWINKPRVVELETYKDEREIARSSSEYIDKLMIDFKQSI